MPEHAGLKRPPLPYESAFGQIARLVTLNELTGAHLLRLAGRKQSIRKWRVFNSRALPIDEFQWHLSDPDTASKAYDIFDIRFCSATLRVCDQCVGSMYHALWHQCWNISHCPFHGCQLRTVCPFCNRSYGEYTFSQALRNRFSCRHCLNSLSAQPATIARHIDLRTHASRIKTALAGALRQLLILAVMGRRLSHLDSNFPFEEVNRWWSNSRSYWDVMHDVGCAYPKHARMSPALTWLVWPASSHHALLDYGEVDLTYTETIDLLRLWLIRCHPRLDDVGERPELFDESGIPRTDLWPPEFLALMLLRHHVEEDCQAWGLKTTAAGIPHTSKFNIVCKTWRSRNSPRLERCAQAEFFQAMIFGRFAAFYWAAKNGVLDGKKFQGDDYVLPCFWGQSRWEPDIAAVAFPTIDGMPLGRFNPSPLRFKDAVDVLYRDGVSRQREFLAVRRREIALHYPHIDQGT